MNGNNLPFKKSLVLYFSFVMFLNSAFAQIPTMQSLPDTTKITYNQISKSLGLVAFPSKNQSQNQQKQDEFECYKWAMDQSGIDPQNIPKVEVEQASGPTGGAFVGGAGGAAAGAAIGAIAGDTGKGAAIGATLGAMRGRRAGQQAQAQQNQQAQKSATAQETAKLDSFKKTYMVCMEGKGYSVK